MVREMQMPGKGERKGKEKMKGKEKRKIRLAVESSCTFS